MLALGNRRLLGSKSIGPFVVKREPSKEIDSFEAKKQKNIHGTNIFYSEILKNCIELAVVDRANSDGSITQVNCKLVTDAISNVFLDILAQDIFLVLCQYII